MAVTATTVAAATTMLAAVAAVFLTLVLCFYIFLCAKRYGVGPPPAGQRGVGPWLRAVFFSGTGGGAAEDESAAAAWCYDGGLDEKSMAKLPRREVGEGEAALDCAVCIAEVAAGETARVLPRCGHAFHVDCVDMWLRSHSTCPLCRCPAVDDPPLPPAVPTPEADPESPNFPTNVLFFGSQDDVSTGGGAQPQAQTLQQAPPPQQQQQGGLRRLIGCGGASPPPQPPQQNCSSQRRHQEDMDADGDLEMGLGESSASRPVKPAQPGS